MKQRKVKMKQIKTIKGLAKELCLREGKKRQIDIANMTEALANQSDIVVEQMKKYRIDIGGIIYLNGLKRAKKKAKPCRK